MALSPSSNAQQARQALADRLAELCRDAGLTGREVATRCGWHPSKSSRIMNARTPPSADDIQAWCRACGAEEQAADLIASLRTAEGMWIGWRRMERAGLKQAQEARLPLFERTRRFRSYSSWLVPGLIQTYGYTESVLRAVQRRRVEVDDVAEAVAVRMERQPLLRPAAPGDGALADEAGHCGPWHLGRAEGGRGLAGGTVGRLRAPLQLRRGACSGGPRPVRELRD